MSRRRVKNINYDDEHDYDENEVFGYSLEEEPGFGASPAGGFAPPILSNTHKPFLTDVPEGDHETDTPQNGFSKIQIATPSKQAVTVGFTASKPTPSAIQKFHNSQFPDTKPGSASSSPSIARKAFGHPVGSTNSLLGLDEKEPSTVSKFDPEAARKAYELRRKEDGKDIINMVVIGHVDAGKSTLMGHLLYKLGAVSKKVIYKYEQECKKMGKQSFQFAWVLDESEEERQRGVTMDVAHSQFNTPTKSVNLLDCPGHKDFIPAMLTGAMVADAAILVANATNGEFESGFDQRGQTREHAILTRSLGLQQLIVVVNKMDTVAWAQERFTDIKDKLSLFLKSVGFKETITFCPTSGLEGLNLSERVSKDICDWYDGPCLVELIDRFQPPMRTIDKPMRFFISEAIKGSGNSAVCFGSMCSGYVALGDKLLVLPANQRGSVKSITSDSMGPVQCAFAGDSVSISISGVDLTHFASGSILSSVVLPCPCSNLIRAKILVFNVTQPITKGYQALFHHQNISVPVTFTRLVSQISKSTGQVDKRHPRCILKNCCAEVELSLEKLVCLESHSENRDLGKFMIRERGVTIAAGTVLTVKPVEGQPLT